MLRGDEVAQNVARLVFTAECQQGAGALHQIARPYQVIAAAFAAGVAPGNAEARDHRTAIDFILMHAQHHRRSEKLLAQRRRNIGRGDAGALRMPSLPIMYLLLPRLIEWLQQSRNRERRCRFFAAGETQREGCLARQLAQQRHIAGTGMSVLPLHTVMVRKILPAVADADIPSAGAAPSVSLVFVGCRQRQAERALFGP